MQPRTKVLRAAFISSLPLQVLIFIRLFADNLLRQSCIMYFTYVFIRNCAYSFNISLRLFHFRAFPYLYFYGLGYKLLVYLLGMYFSTIPMFFLYYYPGFLQHVFFFCIYLLLYRASLKDLYKMVAEIFYNKI